MRALAFILLTDETVFKNDTLKNVEDLYDVNADGVTPINSTMYNQWFADWTHNATNKFPVTIPWKSGPGAAKAQAKINFAREISKALKQMSYYYGVNFTWSLYGGLVLYGGSGNPRPNGDQDIVRDAGAAIWMVPCSVNGDTITYEGDGKVFTIPSDFHVDSPHIPMISVTLTIPSECISAPNTPALRADGGKVMTYNDQFNQPALLAKFHQESNTQYCAFRFYRVNPTSGELYPDEPVSLPNTAQMNLVPGTYKWVVNQTGVQYNPGASYTIKIADTDMYSSGFSITLRLEKIG